jgi:hypothetical protein
MFSSGTCMFHVLFLLLAMTNFPFHKNLSYIAISVVGAVILHSKSVNVKYQLVIQCNKVCETIKQFYLHF